MHVCLYIIFKIAFSNFIIMRTYFSNKLSRLYNAQCGRLLKIFNTIVFVFCFCNFSLYICGLLAVYYMYIVYLVVCFANIIFLQINIYF